MTIPIAILEKISSPHRSPTKKAQAKSQVKKTLISHASCLQAHCKNNKVQLPNEVTLSFKTCTRPTLQTQLTTECFWNWNTSHNYIEHIVTLNSLFLLKTMINAFTSSWHYNLTIMKKKIKLNFKKKPQTMNS